MDDKLDAILKELRALREAVEKSGKQVLTLEEAADFMGIGMNTMYELKNRPGFPVKTCGPRVYRVPKGALLKWMTENRDVYEKPMLRAMGR
jgi:predicted DNA-binding transcriptional regulator AlpA